MFAQRLVGLDALRGIAALVVLGYHLNTRFDLLPIFAHGYLAVDFFFMLSGFVMARTYEPKFANGLGTLRFMAIRARRLWPPMAVGATAGLILALWDGASILDMLPIWAAQMVFLPYPLLALPFLLNPPAWSIFFEMIANALHGLFLHSATVRVLLAIVLASGIGLSALCINLDIGGHRLHLLPTLLRVLLGYCIGIVLARWQTRPELPAVIAPVLLVAGLTVLPIGLVFDLAFVVLACPVIVLAGSRLGGGQVASLLGALSFPLYVVHFPMLELSAMLGLSPWIGAGMAVLAGLALTGRWIDQLSLKHHRPAR